MADGIDRLLRSRTLFIVIGAGHLPYKDGVLNRLANKGYKIKPIKVDFNKH